MYVDAQVVTGVPDIQGINEKCPSAVQQQCRMTFKPYLCSEYGQGLLLFTVLRPQAKLAKAEEEMLQS